MKPLKSSSVASHKHCTLFCAAQVQPVDKIVSLLKLHEVKLPDKVAIGKRHAAIVGMQMQKTM